MLWEGILIVSMEESHNSSPKLYIQDVYFARYVEKYFPLWIRPNHITVLRFIMIPMVLYCLAKEWYGVGIPLFLIAGLTDMIDGSLARVRKQITEWGIAYDPIADKLLVGSTLALLILQHVQSTIAIYLLIIEGILLLVNIAVRQLRIVRMATFSGKLKMVLEVIGIVLLLFATAFSNKVLLQIALVFLGGAIVSAIFSAVSGILYVSNRPNKKVSS